MLLRAPVWVLTDRPVSVAGVTVCGARPCLPRQAPPSARLAVALAASPTSCCLRTSFTVPRKSRTVSPRARSVECVYTSDTLCRHVAAAPDAACVRVPKAVALLKHFGVFFFAADWQWLRRVRCGVRQHPVLPCDGGGAGPAHARHGSGAAVRQGNPVRGNSTALPKPGCRARGAPRADG